MCYKARVMINLIIVCLKPIIIIQNKEVVDINLMIYLTDCGNYSPMDVFS